MAKQSKRPAAKPVPLPLSDFDEARGRWRSEVQGDLGGKANPAQPLRHRGEAALHARGLARRGEHDEQLHAERWASPASRR